LEDLAASIFRVKWCDVVEMEAEGTSQTLVLYHVTTQHHSLEVLALKRVRL